MNLSFVRQFWVIVFSLVFSSTAFLQRSGYWQQSADYQMEIDMNVKNHRYTGKQQIHYTNNSPDTLDQLFFHLYFNAFQPNSMMDVRSRTIMDPDKRVGERISKLSPDEIGYMRIKSLFVGGKAQRFVEDETILQVTLSEPILPGVKTTIAIEFEAQVPVQIRRSGRNNEEGIDYSMAQWYPKLCNYDDMGWHPNPYIGREFYGIWGNFDVKITIDSAYTVGASGMLQNAKEIGHGYAPTPKNRPARLTWHFKADRVHDFMWAADPDYVHESITAYDGTILRFFYQPGEKTTENWQLLPKIMDASLAFMNEKYGKYPYPVYSIIQGGDGGMEYPMATLITGHRPLVSLVVVSIHEWMHSWYHGVLATNESLYPWMDEGFTSYGSNETMNHLRSLKLIPGEVEVNPHTRTMRGFANFTKTGLEEPLTTHADHYITNSAYGVASYSKGELYLLQLSYIVGQPVFDRGMKRYYDVWQFKHPRPTDFLRVMERESGMVLDWFHEHWVGTTRSIDYGIDTIQGNEVIIRNNGTLPMPLDVLVTRSDDTKELYYIPLGLMRGAKEPDYMDYHEYQLAPASKWTHPTYTLRLLENGKGVKYVEIDPSQRLMDVNIENQMYPPPPKAVE